MPVTHPPIKGITPLGPVNPEIFETLSSLRLPYEQEYEITTHGSIRINHRRKEVRLTTKPLRLLFGHPKANCIARSGKVLPDNAQVPAAISWHSDPGKPFAIAADTLPTEVICVTLPDDSLSCEEPDVYADWNRWQEVRETRGDTAKIQKLPGVMVVPLETNFLYELSGLAMHRSPLNLTRSTTERTSVVVLA